MKMKSTLFAGVLAASMAVPAFANDAPVATPLPQFTAVDTQMLFAQDAMPMQLAVLSQQEMMETEGAYVPNLIGGGIGFVTGNYTYLVSSAFNPNATWSWSSYARTVGSSTVVGAINPVSSIRGAATAAGSSFVSAWQFRF